MDDEKPEAEKTEPTEEAEPVVILQCALTFSLSGGDAQQAAAGEGQAVLDTESLSIQPRFGEALHLPLRDILSISEGDYEVHLTLTSKETLTIGELGHYYEDFLTNLSKQRNEVLLKDMLMNESVKKSGMKATFAHSDESGKEVENGQCEPRLYETALVILPERGDPLRIPYSDIAQVGAEDYHLSLNTEFGERFVFSQMGGAFEPFAGSLSDAMNALVLKVQSSLKELLPKADPAVIRRAARLMKEGRAASRRDIEAISPSLWNELEGKLQACGIKETYDFLKSFAQEEEICIGVKRGLLGDLTGEYVWFLVPIYSADPAKPGNAIAMEAASDEGGGRATYFFRMMARSEYRSAMNLPELGQRIARVIKGINRCMVAVNFRREPVYLPEDKLNDPQYSRYRFAIARLPELQALRQLFIGRVIHSSPEQWRNDVTDLLKFNTSAQDDSLTWTKAKGGQSP